MEIVKCWQDKRNTALIILRGADEMPHRNSPHSKIDPDHMQSHGRSYYAGQLQRLLILSPSLFCSPQLGSLITSPSPRKTLSLSLAIFRNLSPSLALQYSVECLPLCRLIMPPLGNLQDIFHLDHSVSHTRANFNGIDGNNQRIY